MKAIQLLRKLLYKIYEGYSFLFDAIYNLFPEFEKYDSSFSTSHNRWSMNINDIFFHFFTVDNAYPSP